MPVTITRRSEACASDLELDTLFAGELDAKRAATVREHTNECARCHARSVEISEAREVYLREYPEPRENVSPEGAVRPNARLQVRRWTASIAVGLTLAAGLIVLLRRPTNPTEVEEGVRAKGGSTLDFHVKRGNVVTRGFPGAVVHPGDELRFTVRSSKRNVAILSVDGADHESVYFPTGDRTAELNVSQDEALPLSTRLDQVLGRETIYGLFCDAPKDLGPIRETLRRDPASPLEVRDCEVVTMTIRKEP